MPKDLVYRMGNRNYKQPGFPADAARAHSRIYFWEPVDFRKAVVLPKLQAIS